MRRDAIIAFLFDIAATVFILEHVKLAKQAIAENHERSAISLASGSPVNTSYVILNL